MKINDFPGDLMDTSAKTKHHWSQVSPPAEKIVYTFQNLWAVWKFESVALDTEYMADVKAVLL